VIFGYRVLGYKVGHRVFLGSSLATLWFSGLNKFLGNF
jgi:hypothetical protein